MILTTRLIGPSQAGRNEYVARVTATKEPPLTHIFAVMIAETISLGMLSLPSVLASIGMVP